MLLTLLALSKAWSFSLGLIGVFFVLFPAIVTGLLIVMFGEVAGERRANRESWRFRRR